MKPVRLPTGGLLPVTKLVLGKTGIGVFSDLSSEWEKMAAKRTV